MRYNRIMNEWLHDIFNIPYALHVRHHKRVRRSDRVVVFIHGIGNNGSAWDTVIERMPTNVSVCSVDLLGFGKSKIPQRVEYNARTQARAVKRTLAKLGYGKNIMIVGHSLGSLVGVELAKLYPNAVTQLLLCSPPLYDVDKEARKAMSSEKILTTLYRQAMARPEDFIKLSAFATKYGVANKTFQVTPENFRSFRDTLEVAIINQTAFRDIQSLSLPINIIAGKLDPLIVPRNIRSLAKAQENISASFVVTGHEITGKYVTIVVQAIERMLQPAEPVATPRSKV